MPQESRAGTTRGGKAGGRLGPRRPGEARALCSAEDRGLLWGQPREGAQGARGPPWRPALWKDRRAGERPLPAPGPCEASRPAPWRLPAAAEAGPGSALPREPPPGMARGEGLGEARASRAGRGRPAGGRQPRPRPLPGLRPIAGPRRPASAHERRGRRAGGAAPAPRPAGGAMQQRRRGACHAALHTALPGRLPPAAAAAAAAAAARAGAMRSPVLWVLLLFPAGVLAQGCPASCQCSQPRTVFCISRRSHTVPQGLPPDTANLYVFENGIRSLSEDCFAGLPALQLLDLSQNQISSLPRTVFRPLSGLSNLDLSSNQLLEITNESFHGLRFLERLYLHRNRIQRIHPQAFDSLESLLELKLQDNQLQAVPPLRLPTLLLLDVSRNRIATLEPGILHVNKLESLKLAGLNLDHIDEELLQKLHNLHELDVSDNRLHGVPVVLKQLRGLTKLSLAGNARISQLQPEDFQELGSLQELDISNLNLNHLPKDFFSAFPRLKAVTAAENPFNCVCQMSWLVSWLRSSQASLQRSEETRCHFPPKNAGRLLQHLEYADLGCPTTTTTTTTAALKATSTRLATPAPSSAHIPPEPSTASPTLRPDSYTLPLVTTREDEASPEARLCPPHTCLNGGTCQVEAHHRLECLCPAGFLGLYCETKAPMATSPAATPAPTRPQQIAIKHIGGTSLKVDLQNYIKSKSRLKGIRLTYSNLSGPDKRPVTLNLPATLAEYTVRELRPNSSYHICIGPLGDRAHEEDFCVAARTLQLTHQQHAPVTQSRHADLTLTVVPTITALLLVAAAVAASFYYVRRRRRHGKARASLGASSGPLELEGAKACLRSRDLAGQSPKPPGKIVAPNSLEYEVPLMEPQCTSASPPRAPRPSYF